MSRSKIPAPRARPARTGFSEPKQAAAPEPVAVEEVLSSPALASEAGQMVAPDARPGTPGKTLAWPPAEPAETHAEDGKAAAPQADHRPHSVGQAAVRERESETPHDALTQAAPAAAVPTETDEDLDDSVTEQAGEVIPFTRPAPAEHSSSSPGGDTTPEHFYQGDHVVYPTHGVGKVERIAVEEIAGHKLELIHITFEENRMTLRVPVTKARSAGLRKLATRSLFDEALGVLRGRARIKRTMWSRRAQEYEAKINSGDPLAIAEVVRDLHRNAGQPDQSFSERQIYEAAMDRLAAELAALDQTDKPTAAAKLSDYLRTVVPEQAKSPEEYSSEG